MRVAQSSWYILRPMQPERTIPYVAIRARVMAYTVEYFKDGTKVATTVGRESLAETFDVAISQMTRHGADHIFIFGSDGKPADLSKLKSDN